MQDKKDDEISIDFSKITKFFKRSKKKEHQHDAGTDDSSMSHEPDKEENISIDVKSIMATIKKYWVPLLILIPILLSIGFRAQPFFLPITDDWAESTVYSGIRANLAEQINQQYPNLPAENQEMIIAEQLADMEKTYGTELKQQIESTSMGFKSRMQDENGQTYLLAIDPYLWYGNSKNYIEKGQFGNTDKDGENWYDLRNGRLGLSPGMPFNSVMTVLVYKIIHPFNKDFSVMAAAFLVPLIIMTLAVIPVFFITRKFAGNIAGFFAAAIFAIHPALLGRTVAGFSDTDPYTVFFPLLAIWLFFEALDANTTKNKYTLLSLSGLSLALFNTAWYGWWYTFDFIIATMGIYLIYHIFTNFSHIKKDVSGFIKGRQVKQFFSVLLSLTGAFIVFRGILALFIKTDSVLIGFKAAYQALIEQPLWFINIKAVAISSIWPNVLTTVAELNAGSWSQIIGSLGGQLLFGISIIGIFLLMFKARAAEEKYCRFVILIVVWFAASIYASLTSQRFIALIAPVFAIAFGSALGIIYDYASKWTSKELNLNKILVKSVMIILCLVLLISPINSANATVKSEIPSYTDAWHESLTAIKDTSDDAIITSWWDFGHWFVAMSERRVTFDGGDQGNRIHWVGKSLLTNDEDETIGILRMLNCGQELAFDTLENYTNDSYKAKMIIDEIIMMDKSNADKALKKADLDTKQRAEILALTHCDDIIDQYYITSQDMVSKAGVWAHFGSWNFTRSNMYNKVNKMTETEGTRVLVEEFNLSEKEANKIFYEIKTTPADQWVTTWPNFASELSDCTAKDDMIICQNGLIVNMTNYDAYLSLKSGMQNVKSLVYAGEDDLIEKSFNGSTIPYSAALISNGQGYKSIIMDPMLAKSTFTRLFFFEGLGSKYFRMFSDKTTFMGLKIQVWNVSFDPLDKLVLKEEKIVAKIIEEEEQELAEEEIIVQINEEEPAEEQETIEEAEQEEEEIEEQEETAEESDSTGEALSQILYQK